MLKYLNTPNHQDDDTSTEQGVNEDNQDEQGNSDLVQTYEEQIAALEYRVAYLEEIARISQSLNATLTLDPLLEKIAQVATDLTNTEACSILLYDKKTGELKFTPATISPLSANKEKLLETPVPLDNSVAGWIFRKGHPLLIRDVRNDSRWNNQADAISDFNTHSILGVPLKIKQEVIGVLELLNKQHEDGFGHDDIQIATTLAAHVAIAIENARLWDNLQQAYRQVAELNQLKNRFVSIASQELKTPLTLILKYATLLHDQVQGEGLEQLGIVHESAIKLRTLIDGMLNLRHLKTGDLDLNVDIFSMRLLIQEVVAELQNLVTFKSLRIKEQYPEGDDPIDIEGDREKIYLILTNLLSNAIKFTPEKGFILVNLSRKGQKIYIRIADTGIGISTGMLKKIFPDSQQISPNFTQDEHGLGVGLAIVKRMVDLHNGQVLVDSVVNKGSQFTVILPISIYM